MIWLIEFPNFVVFLFECITKYDIVLKYSTKEGGTSSPILQDLAVEIQEVTNKYKLQMIYQHIPGIQNTKANELWCFF